MAASQVTIKAVYRVLKRHVPDYGTRTSIVKELVGIRGSKSFRETVIGLSMEHDRDALLREAGWL